MIPPERWARARRFSMRLAWACLLMAGWCWAHGHYFTALFCAYASFHVRLGVALKDAGWDRSPSD